jgi:hypothetical protein
MVVGSITRTIWRRLNPVDWKHSRLQDASAVRLRSNAIKSVAPEIDSMEPTERELLVINIEAELEIELLHEKIDELRAREVLRLTEAVKCLTDLFLQTKQSHRADLVVPLEQEVSAP